MVEDWVSELLVIVKLIHFLIYKFGLLQTIHSLRVSQPHKMAPKEESAELKAKGNKYFASHEWLNAIDSYTKAIEMYDQDPSYYCNRAQVISPRIADLLDFLRSRE